MCEGISCCLPKGIGCELLFGGARGHFPKPPPQGRPTAFLTTGIEVVDTREHTENIGDIGVPQTRLSLGQSEWVWVLLGSAS